MRMALKDCLRLNKDLRWGKLHEKSLTGPKWKRFAQLLNNRHNRKFRKYYDVSSLQLSNFTKRHINTFKNNLQVRQAMRQMYGGISHKTMRKIWGGSRPKPSMECLKIMESRLDVTLMRINVVPTMQASRQLIAHGQVRVNQQENKKPSTQLKRGDIISFHPGVRDRLRRFMLGLGSKPVEAVSTQEEEGTAEEGNEEEGDVASTKEEGENASQPNLA